MQRSFPSSHPKRAPSRIICGRIGTTLWSRALSGLVSLSLIFTAIPIPASAGNAAATAAISSTASSVAVQLGTTHTIDWGQALQTGASAGLTAGLTSYGFFDNGQGLANQSLNDLAGLGKGLNLGSTDQLFGVVGRGVVNAGVNSLITGSDFGNGFVGSVVGDYAALGANSIDWE
ncbi:hypothetical protein AGMMS50225_27820 [Betaproteobacteria bacterium]|nr:hypothetical protein AGMMS50225_27820 [Betaproteobacteria bacterium]